MESYNKNFLQLKTICPIWELERFHKSPRKNLFPVFCKFSLKLSKDSNSSQITKRMKIYRKDFIIVIEIVKCSTCLELLKLALFESIGKRT